ncbi:MAG: 6,7-dimethyl-8-ribityllumazine synthase [Bacteroidetes bacterium]|nr:6,7-dimethyl-8-ribityllumazine synthase [Bacteroidota bacterium]
MASSNDHSGLSQYTGQTDFSGESVAIVVAEWNGEVNEAMYKACLHTLQQAGVQDIDRITVPGAYELPFAAQKVAYDTYSAVICLGTIIKGETRHDEFIASAVAHGLMKVSLKHEKPVIFGVLTVENEAQAWDRAGGSKGNKGAEAAVSALKLIELAREHTGKYDPDDMVDAFFSGSDED